jgi:uncharacterized protein
MTQYFLDTSALTKRYILEKGTSWVRSLTTPNVGNTTFIAQITSVEITSGLNRRVREGHLSASHAHAIRFVLDRYADKHYVVIAFTDQVASRAKDLLEKHPLRAYDSVQLASALEANVSLLIAGSPALTFICSDNLLLRIAAAEGLATDNPNNHP